MDSGPDSVRNLEIWGEAITIVKTVYALTLGLQTLDVTELLWL